MQLIDKFYEKLPDELNEESCWEWRGKLDAYGYGFICHNGKSLKAHRLSYEIYYAEPLNELHCLHHCDNRKCVNPLHLFSGTNYDNVQDKVRKNRCYTGDQKGENNGNSKLTNNQVREIRKLYSKGEYTQTKLSKIYKVNRSTISYIVNNKTYTII